MNNKDTIKWLYSFYNSKFFLIARLTVILILVNFFTLSAKTSKAQETTLSLRMTDVTIQQVLNEISQQSNYTFAWSSQFVNLNKKVNIQVNNQPIDVVLSKLFDGCGVKYKIEGKTVILTPSTQAEQQAAKKITVRGTVTNEKGQTLPGVTVLVKGTTNGTVTDVDGKYSLQVKGNAQTLVFSFVGMKTIEVPIKGRSVINVTMKTAAEGLNEVVVLGYTTKGRNEITGSAVQVKGSNIKKIPVVNVSQALQGKVPGLVVTTSSGTPGSVQNIRIRGVGSITAGNSPLIVIDGVPVINENFSGSRSSSSLSSLAAINSNDIASITVLKDASATSAYGARGSNGVIVITTKKGQMDTKTHFNFNASYGFQNNAVKGLEPLTGEQRKTLFLEGIYNTYGPNGKGYFQSKDSAYDFMVAHHLDHGKLQSWDGVDGNWPDVIKNENAPLQNYNFSATGGGKNSDFYASVGYNKTEATVIGSDFKRISGNLNYSRNFRKNIKFSTVNTVSNSRQNALAEQSGYFANPFIAKYFMSPWEHPYNKDGTINTDISMPFNPLYIVKNDIRRNELTRGLSNSFVKWEIIKNLVFKSLISLDYNIATYKRYANRHYGDGAKTNGYAENSVERNFTVVAQNSLDYTYRFHDHTFHFKALMEYQKNKSNYLYGYGEQFAADGLTNIANAGANWDASSSYYDWSNISYLGMFNYNYLGKYIVDFTFRREGSSRFAPDNRYGNFWSVGGAWNINRESFLSNITFINMLRIRGSFGLSGNSEIGINSYQALLSYDANYADKAAIYPSQFGASNLTWEKNKNYDIGMDFIVWKNKINGSISYFHKKTYDLLQNVPMSRTTGFSSQVQNSGKVLNKGIEATLTVTIFQKSDFHWNVSCNYASLNNEVLDLAKDAHGNYIDIETGSQKVAVGHPIYAWYMRKYAGVDPQTGDALWYVDGVSGKTTTDYYSAKKAFQGASPIPTYTGGLSTHIDYKGFYLDASMYYSGGNKVFERWSRYTHNAGLYSTLLFNGVTPLMNRWQKPGDITNVPKMKYTYHDNSSRTSTRFLYDGNYIRLKDVTLGYNFPKALLSHVGLTGLTVYVKGTNLLTWVKDDRLKYDPEVRANGFTRLTTPPVKSVVFGLNLNF